MTVLVGIDTGSAHAGVVALRRTPGAPFPFALLARDRLDVDPVDLAPATREAWAAILAHPGCRVVIEGGNPYGRGGLIKSAAAVCLQHAARLGDRIAVRCEDAAPPVPVAYVVAQTWRAAVVPRELRGQGVDKLGRPRTFVQDAHVRAALALYLSPEDVAALASVDERDAAGAVIGVVLAEEEAERGAAKARERTAHVPAPRAPRERATRAPAKPKARASLADRMAASRKRAAARAGVPAKIARCQRCGGPMKGHIRDLPCPANEAQGIRVTTFHH